MGADVSKDFDLSAWRKKENRKKREAGQHLAHTHIHRVLAKLPPCQETIVQNAVTRAWIGTYLHKQIFTLLICIMGKIVTRIFFSKFGPADTRSWMNILQKKNGAIG